MKHKTIKKKPIVIQKTTGTQPRGHVTVLTDESRWLYNGTSMDHVMLWLTSVCLHFLCI